jgi:FHS family L-fucose permease-like MFS transporter
MSLLSVLLRIYLLPCTSLFFLSYNLFLMCFQCIFTLGTKNLGVHTKRGSGLIVMVGPLVYWLCSIQGSHYTQGVGGGAWYPPAQGALADATSTRHSYLVPLSGYIAMTIYAA